MSKDLGDFQTPALLARDVLNTLASSGVSWARVLEPTCGEGVFIRALASDTNPPTEIRGIEIQDIHYRYSLEATAQFSSIPIKIRRADIFAINLHDLDWSSNGPLLIVGNPPWVTNSQLGALGSSNVPEKKNLKGLSGIEALTGGSNFDIAEYIWLKLIWELRDQNPGIALLCKTSVARNVLHFAHKTHLPFAHSWIRRIDAKKWFNAAVDACLFFVKIQEGEGNYETPVYPNLTAEIPQQIIGIRDGELVSDIAVYDKVSYVEGVSPLQWRQGLKHDAASVMELKYDEDGNLWNNVGQPVCVEGDYIYPLLKGSDLRREVNAHPKRAVIVTQTSLGQDTAHLEHDAPLLWEYLCAYSDIFARRKSSIYKGKPPFSVFGIGRYSFAQYKVAVSGLYKIPKFQAVGHVEGRSYMFDDTCYFIACNLAQHASLVAALFNDPICINFISSISFPDAKRPVTKKLLQRIDLVSLVRHMEIHNLLEQAKHILHRIEPTQSANWPSTHQALADYIVELGNQIE